MEPKPRNFRVSEMFDALETQFAQTFSEQGLRLRFVRTSLTVHSDPSLLRRILQNFISNARRYTREGGVLVGCRRQGDHVSIQVIDTGVGIAESDQKAVFQEFHRLSDGAERTKRGLGLGLAIVDRIARLLGHEITLRSQLGKGSCFEVLVPRATGAVAVTSAQQTGDSRRASSLDGQTILCVDNEEEILDGMQGLLSRWGAAPIVAVGRAEALDAMEKLKEEQGHWPALLLVDYHLDDDVTGLDVIAALRERADEHLPAVILTADYSNKVADLVHSAGHAMLRKPVKPAALRALINRVLSRRARA
jgi:CheY-like chemotaxis protein/anti-sigma regulatory factor (Ser/Thr protein kinase)